MQPFPALTFRTIGGILDFYVFTGPTPDLVLQQYSDVVGKPLLPPYWTQGLHLGSQRNSDSEVFKHLINRTRGGHFPCVSKLQTSLKYMYYKQIMLHVRGTQLCILFLQLIEIYFCTCRMPTSLGKMHLDKWRKQKQRIPPIYTA